MRVLVTGGAGLIGSHSVDRLLEGGHEVRILDSLELPTHAAGKPDYLPDAAEFVHADVRDEAAVRAALDGVDAVLHLAATGGFTPRIAAYVDVNSLATARLLETVREHAPQVKKIVVASSIAVYGEGAYAGDDGVVRFPGLRAVEDLEAGRWEMRDEAGRELAPVPTPERASVDPASAYAISKYDQERLVLSFGRDHGLPTVAMRYFVTYGPRQSVHNPYTGVCTIFATRIAHGHPLVIYEDGAQTRDFVFVEDVARANVFALESDALDGQAVNIGRGVPVPLNDLAELLQEVLGQRVEVQRPGSFRPADVRHMVADVSRLAEAGYRCETTLEQGLGQWVEWLRQQGPLPDVHPNAERELEAAGVLRRG